MRSWMLEGWLEGERGATWQDLSLAGRAGVILHYWCISSVAFEVERESWVEGWMWMSESLWGHHAGEADEQQHSSGSSQSSVSSLNTSPWWSLNLMINNPQWTMNTVQLMCYNNNEHEMKVCECCRVDDGGHADRKLFKTCYNLIVCRSSPVHRSCC